VENRRSTCYLFKLKIELLKDSIEVLPEGCSGIKRILKRSGFYNPGPALKKLFKSGIDDKYPSKKFKLLPLGFPG